ncbi:MAG TPA: DUF3108 domain-containing protein [Bacteriovoracaceae bacterium]|nr:DUF3108 domain-containing protein [Bacteriovoracaceae bacterium]
MKILVLSIFLLSNCSWRQKDFKKEMEKPVEPTTQVQVDEKLREKFEVKPVEEPTAPEAVPAPEVVLEKPQVPGTAGKKKKVPAAPTVKVPPAVEAKVIPPVVKGPPKDYPPELLALNAKAKKVWDQYKPNHKTGEKIYLDIHYLGMTVGKILVQNHGKKMIDDKEVWHFHARFKSAPFYSNIYELDDTVDTYVTTDKFLSIKYSLIQRESKQDIDDLQLHDRENLKTFWFYHQKKSNGSVKDKKDEKPIPYYSTDAFSILFLYQGLPLKNGDVYEIPIINKGKLLVLKSLVEGREKIKTDKGVKNAVRIHATTQYTGETLKSGDLYFWFSDDDRKTLLKAQAKIKIGSVTADIVD